MEIVVTVTVPADVQAAYADSLPAAVLIASKKLYDQDDPDTAGTFAARKIGLVCEPGPFAQSFRTTLHDAGCGVETQVHAWLESEARLRDWLETRPDAKVSCSDIEAIQVGVIAPSAAPSATAPQGESIAFSGQHSRDCDRDLDSVILVLDSPSE